MSILKRVKVLKFGGTSVGNTQRMKKVAHRVASYRRKGFLPVVVVSAMGDTTDELLGLALKANSSPPSRELDLLLSTGEIISASLLVMILEKLGFKSCALTGHQVGILTDSLHTQAKILSINPQRIMKELKKGQIVVVAGFQGKTLQGEVTTLGRGGSDLTAVALAYCLGCRECEIFTDVEGIYTADPRLVKNARILKFISYEEMAELASLGSQVMQTRSVEVAKKYAVRIHVRSSFKKKEGTMIADAREYIESPVVSGITLNSKEAKITICNVPDRPGIAAKIFEGLASRNINVDMIVQNVSKEKETDISFTVLKRELERAYRVARDISSKVGASQVLKDEDICRVSIVGVGMRTHVGVASKMFKTLAKNKINIEMISTSEISISCIIKKSQAKKAVQALHKEFELYRLKIKTRSR